MPDIPPDSRPPFGTQPLAGIVVVSVEQAIAAPFATRQLADLGARVIKIERPGVGDLARGYDRTVDGLASHFVWTNRGKESVELDVRSERGNAVLHRLIDRADVFVQNLAPGAADRLGVGAEALQHSHPRLITCDISGYGSGGPYSARKAYDLLIQCESGLVSITGTPDEGCKVGLSIADICAGMYAFTGILTALMQRLHTGRGSNIEISMLEAMGEWMGYADYYARYGGTAPARAGASHATIAPYGPFQACDGEVVNLGLQNDREWSTFCTVVLQRADLVADSRFAGNAERVRHRTQLDDIISSVTATLTSHELVDRLENAGIAYAVQRTMADFASHPQLAARDRWRTFESPVGPLTGLRPPVTVRGVEPIMGAVPALGEHTERVLAWLESADVH